MIPTKPNELGHALLLAGLAACWIGFLTTSSRLQQIRQPEVAAEMQVTLPRFMQVVLSGGDRFLAANIATFRTLITDTKNQRPDRYVVQAVVQQDAAWLNPRHEDNYYLAAAHLPWNNQVAAAQRILEAASETRPFDMLPPFFHAFNEYYFRHDAVSGAKWMKIASAHAEDEHNRINLQKIAARWAEKGQDRHEVVRMLESMAKQSRYRALRRVIELRAERVRQLIQLDTASAIYREKYRHAPPSLDALLQSGLLNALPQDPFGQGYTIDAQGIAQIKTPTQQ